MPYPVRMGEALERILISCGQDQAAREKLRQGFKENRIFALWEDAVGETLATHTRPDRIQRGRLVVFVSDSAWMQELQFLKSEILKKLNKKLGRGTVKDVRFQIGDVSYKKEAEKGPGTSNKNEQSLSVIDSRVLAGIDEHVRVIKDEGVRESVRKYLIAASLSSVERKSR